MILTLAFVFLVAAAPAPPPKTGRLSPVNRIATYGDIPSQYGSIYKISESCPDTLVFGEPSIDERQVALVDIASIQEDSSVCSGPSPMVFVSEATVEQEGLLSALQLSGFQDALNINQNTASILNSSVETSMLVGWHADERLCGSVSYPPSTIYFVIREMSVFRISFNRGPRVDVVTIPPRLKTLLIVTQNSTVCLLADRSSNPSADATLISTENGESTTTALVPFGSEAAPSGPSPSPSITPAVVASPAQATPVSTGPMPPQASEPTSLEPFPSPSEEDMIEPSPSNMPLQPVIPDVAPSIEPEESSGALSGESAANGAPSGIEAVPSSSMDVADDEQAAPSGVAEATDTEEGAACFPGKAQVTLECGEKRTMAQLAVGDRVVTGNGSVSDVILFTHSERDSMNRFVRLATECGRSLSVSGGHYLYVNGGMLRAAESLSVRDRLEVAGIGFSRIVAVERVYARGLYNPQTLSGSIVVDGFKASTYTTAVEPALAHCALLAPVRFVYSMSVPLAGLLARAFEHGSPVLTRLVRGGDVAVERLQV